MKITIINKAIRQNILLFKQLILRTKKKNFSAQKTAEKTYAAFVNRLTGELRFVDLEKESSSLSDKDWKPITIQLRIDEREDQNAFEIIEAGSNPEAFQYSDLEPRAYQVMKETIHLLNKLSPSLQKNYTPARVIEEISVLEIVPLREDRKKDLIHEAWHQVDRIGAEKLLENQSIGTYLFRKDEYAVWLENKLNQQFQSRILCITLTFNCKAKKICEKTVVYKEHQWMIYDDDPSLQEVFYPNIESLLNSLGESIKTPLLNR